MKILKSKMMAGTLAVVICTLFAIIPFESSAQYRGVRFKHEGIGVVLQGGPYIPFEVYRGGGGANIVVGNHFSEKFYGGISLGIDGFEQNVYMPAGVDMRYFFMDQTWSPFVTVDGGYGLFFDDMSGSLVYYGGSVGIRYFFNQVIAFIPSMGYRGYLAMNEETRVSGSSPLGAWTIRIGFSF